MRAPQLASSIERKLQVWPPGDPAINGLQVLGDRPLRMVGTAVTLTARVIEAALDLGVDTLVVHHGILWHGKPRPFVGAVRRRLELLLKHDVSVLAYHLPLDADPLVGNSVQLLAEMTGYDPTDGPFAAVAGSPPYVWRWDVADVPAWSANQIGHLRVRSATSVGHRSLADPACSIRTVTVATGKGDTCVDGQIGLLGDLFVTGEVSLQTLEAAEDERRALVCVGHHDSEVAGTRSLGSWIQSDIGIETTHIDIACPI